MAPVGIGYNGVEIAQTDGPGTITLKTSGKYCRNNIEVVHTTRSRTYEITLSKSSGWVLLTALDADVLAHINDDAFTAALIRQDGYAYEFYAGGAYFAGNRRIGVFNNNDAYGFALRHNSETSTAAGYSYHPANNTATNQIAGEFGAFRLSDGRYYLQPGDGFIQAGTYRLTLAW